MGGGGVLRKNAKLACDSSVRAPADGSWRAGVIGVSVGSVCVSADGCWKAGVTVGVGGLDRIPIKHVIVLCVF
jgi:hypothetical protein